MCHWKYGLTFLSILTKYEEQRMGLGLEYTPSSLDCFNFFRADRVLSIELDIWANGLWTPHLPDSIQEITRPQRCPPTYSRTIGRHAVFWMTLFSLGRILEASLFSVFGLESHSIYSDWLLRASFMWPHFLAS